MNYKICIIFVQYLYFNKKNLDHHRSLEKTLGGGGAVGVALVENVLGLGCVSRETKFCSRLASYEEMYR